LSDRARVKARRIPRQQFCGLLTADCMHKGVGKLSNSATTKAEAKGQMSAGLVTAESALILNNRARAKAEADLKVSCLLVL